jgi:hypothetical protein
MDVFRPRLVSGLSIAVLLASTLIAPALTLAKSGGGGSSSSGQVRSVSNGGTINPSTGAFTPSGINDVDTSEFPVADADGNGPDAYAGNIVDRSLSSGHGGGAPTTTGKKAKSNPTFVTGFEGLNHYQQRYSRGGNQFSVEPPDQGLCVGNGFELEVVNDVLNVFNSSGASVLPDNTATNIVAGLPRNVNHAVDLNSFYGYIPAVNRSTGIRGQFVTDPSCLYDASTNRFYMVVLTLETVPTTGAFTHVNHLDLAVSQTGDPTGMWNIYRMDVTNDGTPGNTGGPCPCLGDYPHIGADANGIYLTTNSYPWGPGDFDGAQIYALPKAALASGASSVNLVHFDTTGMVNATSPVVQTEPGFTVWPAQSPNSGGGNTEFFMSSNAGEEAAGAAFTGASTNLIVWSMSNTNSLNSASPSLNLSNQVLDVEQYAIPPKASQPGSGNAPGVNVPQGYCLNDETTPTIAGTGCYRLLTSTGVHNATKPEVVAKPDSNDTRMQQVTYANGKLWGSLDTAVTPDGSGNRAGVAWFIVNPNAGKIDLQGYLGAAGYDFTYPAIGVTSSGRGIMAFTAMGDSLNPSAAYVSIDAKAGVGQWNIVPGGQGAAPDDGFSGYKAQNFPNPLRSRWGDYGSAAVDGNSIWIASEYISHACDYATWGGPFFGGTGDNLLGTCAATAGAPGGRTALANWSTFISKFNP